MGADLPRVSSNGSVEVEPLFIPSRHGERDGILARVAEMVARAAAVVTRAVDLDEVTSAIADQVMALGAMVTTIFLVSEDRRFLELAAHRGLAPDLVERMRRVQIGSPLLAALAARSGRIEPIEDTSQMSPEFDFMRELSARTGARCAISVPLRARRGVLATMTWSLPYPHRFTNDELRALSAIAEVFAAGIEHAQARAREAQLLAQVEAGKERFRMNFENAPIGMAVVGLDGQFWQVNHALCEIVGYSADELTKLRYQDITHPDDLGIDFGLTKKLLAGEIPRYRLAKRYIHKRGAVVQVVLHVSLVRDAQGAPGHLIAQVEDVTERRRAEEERERLLARIDADRRTFQTIFDNAPCPIVLMETEPRPRLLLNPPARALFGDLGPHDSRELYLDRIFRPDGTLLSFDELPTSRALRGEAVVGEEVLLRRPDGVVISLLTGAMPICDKEQRIIGAVVAGEDISALKALERLREEWTSVVAHDLRQPLTVITFYAALVAKQPALRSKAQHILTSAMQLNRMIEDLLDVSRIEARRMDLRKVEVCLPTLVKAVVERTMEVTRGHRIELDVRGEIPAIEADPGRLEQVLGNLLSNAAKYGAPEAPITIRVERREAEVLVAVKNKGDGVEPDELAKLFTRYHRTRRAKSGRVNGLGLGLYITKGLIEAHGGRIWAESTPGKTTTFCFSLPLMGSAH